MSSTSDLTTKARFLRNAAPEAYDQFLAAFDAYTAQLTITLVQTTDDVRLAQGHAQLALKLLRALEEVKHHG